jgi:hypothetical protein
MINSGKIIFMVTELPQYTVMESDRVGILTL